MKGSDRFALPGATCRVDDQEWPIADLSLGGFFVISNASPPLPGQVLSLELRLPGRAPLALRGKVTWLNGGATRPRATLPAGYGVQITRIDMTAKLVLVEILRRAQEPGTD